MSEPLTDKFRAEKLLQVARERYCATLTQAEGEILARSSGSADDPIPVDSTPQVRSEFVRWLATDPEAAAFIDAKGIRVWSVTVLGKLDFQACSIPHQLSFFNCGFEDTCLLTADVRALYIIGCRLKNLIADGVSVHGPLSIKQTTASGSVRLIGARLARNLDCSGTMLTGTGTTLVLDGAVIEGSVFLHDGFRSAGEIRMLNARVKGDLGCDGAIISAATERGLSLDKVIVEGNLSLSNGFRCTSMVAMPGGQVLGDFDCGGAELTATGMALNLVTIVIRGHLYLRNGFKSSGEVCLHSASIGKTLDCGAATFTGAVTALRLEGATVGGNVFLCQKFNASGRVELQNSHFGGDVNCDGAALTALYCLNMKLEGDLIWTSIQNPQKTGLWLNGARVHNIRDDKQSWPGPCGLHADGLIYQELTLHASRSDKEFQNNSYGPELPLRASDRITWLNLQNENDNLESQPWMQLASLLKAKGDDTGAKKVIFEMRRHQAAPSWFLLRWAKLILALLEEQPLRIAISLALFIGLGTGVFWRANCAHVMSPTEKEIYMVWQKKAAFDSAYPPFNPFIYSMENGLPLLRLGQDDKWAPDPSSTVTVRFTSYRFLAWFRWFLIFAGWAQATILASAIARRFEN